MDQHINQNTDRGADATIRSLGTILGLWAHPDDETYLAGALMAAASRRGQRVVSVAATPGERGGPPEGDPSRLARVRRRELRRAMHRLGVQEHTVLSYRDGGCADVDLEEGAASFARLIEHVRPDTIITFGPDGLTGHADHRAVSRWATAAWQSTGARARLLYATTTPEFAERNRDVHDRIDAFEPGLPQCRERSELALRLVLDDATLATKVAALRAHRSQTLGVEQILGAARYARWWDEESFVDAVVVASAAVGTHPTASAAPAPS
jgi:LmbE family N-acetylglucosaminyl deacetylase